MTFMRRFTLLWLLASTGGSAFASNPIVQENQNPGTTAWQIGQNPFKLSNDTDQWIRGYASAASINRGQTITFNITVNPYNWKTGPVLYTIDVYRIGWYGGNGGRLMLHLGPFTGVQQPGGTASGGVTSPGCPYDPTTGMIACQWTGDGLGHGSYTLDTSKPTLDGAPDWTSGIYLALLTTNQQQYGPTIDPDHQTYIIFTIRDDSRTSDVLFQQAVATYQAYNNYPNDGKTGKSLYDSGSFGALTTLGTLRAVKVSFDRPYTYSDHTGAGEFLKWELYCVRWLERNGYDVAYSTDVDVHANGSQLLNHKVVVSAGHTEYWSNEMRNALESARDQGISAAFLGANSMYSQIRFEPSPVTGVPNRVEVAYKDSTLDPVNNPSSPSYNPALTTIPWRNPPVSRAEQQTLGTMYQDYFPETDPAKNYIVANSSNWFYAGAGFTDGSVVPGILGYELDGQLLNYSLPNSQPGSYTLLSSSPFTGANGSWVSSSALYQAANGPGAWVFNAGTIYWSLALDNYVPPAGVNTGSVPAVSTGIQQATANFLNLAIGQSGLPAAPTNLLAMAATSSSIVIAWSNNATSATAVLVERSADNVTFSQIASLAANATTYTDTGLTANTLYYYRVRAQNAQGNSAYSNTTSATTLAPPAAPTNLTATSTSTTSVNLAWTNNATNATAVLVERSTDNVTFDQIASLAATAASYTDTGLTTNTLYYYRVRAQNAQGNSAYSNTASVTTLALPAAPTSLTATGASTTAINLAWKNNATNATAVLVERSIDNVTFSQIASLAATAATYTDTGLTANTLYYYRVRAQNTQGTSAYSNTASATTLSAPAAPTNLVATAASSTSISLTWTNNATNATAMLIERSTNGNSFSQIASTGGTATSYTNTGLTVNTLYYYRVRAQNAQGTSAYSNVASATTSGPPTAPSGLTATTLSTTSINLAWTNTATNATAILVESSTNGTTFTQIASLAGTATTYGNTGLIGGTSYSYRVRAQNAQGNSAYSNVANATTSGPPPAPSNVRAGQSSVSPRTQINVYWNDNSNSETGFDVFRSPDGKTFTQIGTAAANATQYNDASLTPGTAYYYYIESFNAGGTSAPSNTDWTVTAP